MKHSAAERFQTTNRRQWFTSALRYTLLGGLGILTGHLVLKSQNPACRRNIPCQHCRAWHSCNLPAAIDARREKGDSHLLCEAPGTDRRLVGPFRQKVAVTFFHRRKARG